MNEILNWSEVEAKEDSKSTKNELDLLLINMELSENAIKKTCISS